LPIISAHYLTLSVPRRPKHGEAMRSFTAALAVLGAALVCAFALSAVDASDSMDKYRKRTGKP